MRSWVKVLAKTHGAKGGELNYIFVDDEALLQMNIDYLDHNTYTDIITFNTSEEEKLLEGDIFISADRVKDNAKKFKTTTEKEWIRVMAHGLLHLAGFNDKKPKEKKIMRAAEEAAIKLYLTSKKKK